MGNNQPTLPQEPPVPKYFKCGLCDEDLKDMCHRPTSEDKSLIFFCAICERTNIYKGSNKNNILLDELMVIISYYLTEKKDILSIYRSNCFPMLNKSEYWINRLHNKFPLLPKYM